MFSRKVRVTREPAASAATVTRDDIPCGLGGCSTCADVAASSGTATPLSSDETVWVPVAGVLTSYIDVVDDPTLSNFLLLSTELAAVARSNRSAVARLQRATQDTRRRVYVFANDRHRSTASVKTSHESDEDFSFRAIRATVAWMTSHGGVAPRLVVLVPREEEVERFAAVGLRAATVADCVKEQGGDDHPLLDRLAAGALQARGAAAQMTEHWPASQVQAALGSGSAVRGKFRASEGSCFFGEVRGRFGSIGERVLLPGRGAVNRAIHDDVVAVLVDPVTEWRPPVRGGAPASEGTDPERLIKEGFTATGRVVGILEAHRRPYCGSIDIEDGKTAAQLTGQVSVLFRPKTSRIPRIRISTQQAANLATKRLRVVVDDWPVNSAFPVGHYTDVIGDIGDKDTEAKVILLENDIPHYDFSEEVYDCLPKGEWSVEPEEEKKRKDLRNLCVCSVDPLGCRDIDDALHYRELPNGNVEIGVHIADVTHFVQEGSALDLEAQKRSTSVYLVDRRINMLPQLLTENLCSLVGDEDRYAFSAIWELTQDCNIVTEWFGKTIIRSRAALYYGDAQRMIDDADDNSELTLSLRGLMRFSRILKARRDEAGALTLGSQEFKFKIDNDHVNPTDMMQYQTFETNSMIEEWMLYANVAAARHCYKHFASHALLRRHQQPSERSLDDLNAALKARGLPLLDASSSKALNQSLNACIDSGDPFINRLVRILTTRCLKQAQYFCSGDLAYEEFAHFGLAMPIYTHFTSPIRRYADVVVHRQLAAITGFGEFSVEKVTSEQIAAIAANINYRHEMAQKAGRDSQNLFTGFFLRKYGEGQIPVESGYVVRTTDMFVSVMVPAIGQEGRVPIETVTREYRPLDPVRVKMTLVKEGDVLSAKLAFRIVDESTEMSEKRHRTEQEGQVTPGIGH